MKKNIIIIGAGFGGLSAAIRLAAAGFDVEVFEQQPFAGGKAGTKHIGQYRFDTGPSLITMKNVFEDLFRAADRKIDDYLKFVPLDPICTYFFNDGSRLSARGNPDDFAAEVERQTTDSKDSVHSYLSYSKGIYKKTSDLFLYNSLHQFSTYLKPEVWKGIFGKGKLDANRTMDEANRSFFKDSRMVQLFNRYATYNGSDPFQVPATLNIIPYIEYSEGSYACKTGIYAIPQAMRTIAEELGVRFHFETKINSIVYSGNRVMGIAGDFGERQADIIISNTDARRTYEELLGDPQAPYALRYSKLEPSSSGLVFFWGMKRTFPELTVNNIFFSADYPAEFHSIFSELRVPADPTVYINITGKIASGESPPNGENWFVLVNAPRNAGQDWQQEINKTRNAIITRIEKVLGVPIEKEIAVEDVLTPAQIEEKTGSLYGSLYGISSNTKTAAFLRHPAYAKRYRGLYFCGGSVHPGGGMPLSILSGKIAAETILKQEG